MTARQPFADSSSAFFANVPPALLIEDVDAAGLRGDLAHDALDGVGITDVELLPRRRPPRASRRAATAVVDALCRSSGEHDPAADGAEAPCHLEPDPARAAGDQRRSSGEQRGIEDVSEWREHEPPG